VKLIYACQVVKWVKVNTINVAEDYFDHVTDGDNFRERV